MSATSNQYIVTWKEEEGQPIYCVDMTAQQANWLYSKLTTVLEPWQEPFVGRTAPVSFAKFVCNVQEDIEGFPNPPVDIVLGIVSIAE